MSESKIVTQDFKKLDKFVKALAVADGYAVEVGILGNKTNRKGGGMTNADIGFLHEFGTAKMKRRSFLRMPLLMKTNQIIKDVMQAGALRLFAEGKIELILKYLGLACESVILDAFDSAGFGEWDPDKVATTKRKKGSTPLIDTGQLRRSITSRVVKI